MRAPGGRQTQSLGVEFIEIKAMGKERENGREADREVKRERERERRERDRKLPS